MNLAFVYFAIQSIAISRMSVERQLRVQIHLEPSFGQRRTGAGA